MKRKRLLTAILCAVLLTGCGSSDNSSAQEIRPNSKSYSDAVSSADYDTGYYSDTAESYGGTGDIEAPAAEAGSTDEKAGLTADSIQKEMLVYSCYMTVDTLEFDTSLDSFKNTLEQYGGFVETENFSDGGSDGRWYDEAEEKWKSYSATVRIPSKNYDTFCNTAGDLGDLRSKTSSVDNLSQEYSDLKTTLDIYEAKEQRYITLLSSITEDEYAVSVERELTEIQIKIAGIKTRMNQIDTDVAYSYVYFTLNEVKEYVAGPVKTDTFADRLGNTLSNAGSGFLDFLERLLFFIIYTAPYAVLLALFIFIISRIRRWIKRRRERRYNNHPPYAQPQVQQPQPPAPAPDTGKGIGTNSTNNE